MDWQQMVAKTASRARQAPMPLALALMATLAMGISFTVLDTIQPPEPALSLLAFVPGGVSTLALAAAGLPRTERGLRFARISMAGAGVLAANTILLLPVLGSSTSWVGWRWLPALAYAPASGMAQELYFRASLLPALERAFRGRKIPALLVHAAIFVGYHFRTFRAVPSPGLAIAVAVVLFAGGCGWGWQVQRDRTVVWTMAQHSLFLILMSMFAWV